VNRERKGQRIVWLVRVLASLGLLMVVITIGLIGFTLAHVRTERALAITEQDQLNRASDELSQRAVDSRVELQTVLDETLSLTNQTQAVAGLIKAIGSLSSVQNRSDGSVAAAQFAPLCARLTEVSQQGQQWRTSYDKVWDDVRHQRTLGQVRGLITQICNDVDDLEGRHRLEQAIKYRRWRNTTNDTANELARAILEEQGRERSQGLNDFKGQLAECARLVELLGGEEQMDSLADLKDNKLKPVLDRLSRTSTAFGGDATGAGSLTPKSIEQIRAALFGAGPDGSGGLFTLRRDTLRLRREREKMKAELAALFQDIESANGSFAQSAQARTTALTQQMEGNLAAGWRHMLYVGAGCSGLFLWLAWLISRGIGGQVRTIDRARAEAERENAERRQAEQALRKSEAQLHTIVENLAEGVAVSALNGQLLHFNRAALAMHGFSKLDEALRHLDEFPTIFEIEDMDGASLPTERWPLSRVLGGEKLRDLDVRVRHIQAGWERVFSYGGGLVYDEGGQPLMAVITISDITARKSAEAELEEAHKELLETSRQAGMAEVATGVLHNVGNVLNSVNVSSTCLVESVKKSKAASLSKVVGMLREHGADLGTFITSHPKGKQVPGYLAQLAEHLNDEQAAALKELGLLQKNIEHIKDIVSMQQSFAKVSGVTETLQASDLVEDALRMNVTSLTRHDIQVIKEFEVVPPITTEKHKVMQILVNFVRNAKHSCDDSGRKDKRLTIRVSNGTDCVRIIVADNGVGIPPENLTRIFAHGFTTKKDGHGFGLHSGALAAKQLGGELLVHSDGPGQGATFTLELPLKQAIEPSQLAA